MRLIFVFAFALSLFGQQKEAAWDDSPRAAELVTQVARMKPLLDQLLPEDWVAQGASVTYIQQWRTAQDELAALTGAANAFDKQPKKLTLALDTYFRLQSIEWRQGKSAVKTKSSPSRRHLVSRNFSAWSNLKMPPPPVALGASRPQSTIGA